MKDYILVESVKKYMTNEHFENEHYQMLKTHNCCFEGKQQNIISGKKTTYGASIQIRKITTSVSIALSKPSIIQKEMEDSALCNLSEDKSVKNMSQ